LSEVYAFLADGDGWIDGHGRVGALGPWCQARSFQMFTLWLFNIAMGNGPFIDGLPIKNGWIFHGYVPNGGDSRLPRQTIMSPEFQQDGEGMAGTVGTSKNLERGEEWPRLQLGGISLRVSYDFNVALSTLFLEPYSLTMGIANAFVTLCVKCEET